MSTLIRFFDNNQQIIETICIYGNHNIYYDFIKWIESHDIGNIHHILTAYRIHARHKYGYSMFVYDLQKNVNNIRLANLVDIIKINHTDTSIVKLYNFITNNTIINTPINHRILYHS
jgi:hypothetical protein